MKSKRQNKISVTKTQENDGRGQQLSQEERGRKKATFSKKEDGSIGGRYAKARTEQTSQEGRKSTHASQRVPKERRPHSSVSR